MSYVFSNNAVTTLDGAIDDDDSSLAVDDASSFPSSGDFTIIIDSEILLVTGVSSNTFTVSRGQESTAAASHSNGAGVRHILTADFLNDIVTNVLTPMGTPQTFTPTVGGGGSATFSTLEGRYVQVGKLVVVQISISVSGNGSGSSQVTVTGGPAPRTNSDYYIPGMIRAGTLSVADMLLLSAQAQTNWSHIYVSPNNLLLGNELANGQIMRFSGAYEAE